MRREGENLHYDAIISFVDAALGSSIEIPTLSGKSKIKIEPGTQSGKVFRLRSKGIPQIQGYGKGDLFVHIHVWTPTKLSKDEKSIIESFRDAKNFNPSENPDAKGFFSKMKQMFS